MRFKPLETRFSWLKIADLAIFILSPQPEFTLIPMAAAHS